MRAWFLGAMLVGLPVAPAVASTAAPLALVVSTAKGEVKVPVRSEPPLGPMLPAPQLVAALGGSVVFDGAWATVEIARQPFRFLLGAPVYAMDRELRPLASEAWVRRDTLYLPLQFATQILPSALATRFRYEADGARLVDLVGRTPVVAKAASTPADDRLPNGLRRGHVVTIDPGHGGVDPGNPGIYFPRGLKEKHVTLQMGLLVRQELQKRGIGVIMTRTTDTLIDLRNRGKYCKNSCDLFVSIHVNSLPKRPGANRVRGFETYFLAEAKTEDAARVAKMENEAVRFESSGGEEENAGSLDFILKDLQLNEHLRESARLAELVQSHLEESHTGPNLGVKQAGFAVLTTARRPAVLVEIGFSTNPQDAELMTASRSQRNLAASIADAVVAYLLEYERRVGSGVESASSGGRSQ
jgi:N-acetylmuramoyl-L-alanine amidase